MTREEALAKRQELIDAATQALQAAQTLTAEHNLHYFEVVLSVENYGTKYTSHVEVSNSGVEAWVSSTYVEDDWESSEC